MLKELDKPCNDESKEFSTDRQDLEDNLQEVRNYMEDLNIENEQLKDAIKEVNHEVENKEEAQEVCVENEPQTFYSQTKTVENQSQNMSIDHQPSMSDVEMRTENFDEKYLMVENSINELEQSLQYLKSAEKLQEKSGFWEQEKITFRIQM